VCSVNSNSRTCNSQCSLFSHKNCLDFLHIRMARRPN
jgi:hypothetical protein